MKTHNFNNPSNPDPTLDSQKELARILEIVLRRVMALEDDQEGFNSAFDNEGKEALKILNRIQNN